MVCFKNKIIWSSLVAQQIKDLALSLLWYRFGPWPGNISAPWAQFKKKKRQKKKYSLQIKAVSIIYSFTQRKSYAKNI